jgi:hypothetical protein
MTCRLHSCVFTIAGLTLCAGLAAVAPLASDGDDMEKFLFTDNFNNNSIGGIWDAQSVGGVSVAETNHRLQFAANGATGGMSFAGLEISPWGINMRRDFQIELNTVMNLNNVTGNREVFAGVGFAPGGQFPDTGTVLGFGVLRQSNGLFLGWIKLTDGVVVDSLTTEITSVSGQLTVEFDRSDDELRVSQNGETVIYEGFFAEFGEPDPTLPMVVTVGCVTFDGNISFPGNRVRLDQFQFNGYKRTRS